MQTISQQYMNMPLSFVEFYKGMERLNLKGVTQNDVTLLINEVDNNADGEIGE